jgi:RNA polymerase sigma factor (sigma-70 family)
MTKRQARGQDQWWSARIAEWYTTLSRDEQRQLVRLAQVGDLAARNRLIESCTPMLLQVAAKHCRQHRLREGLSDLMGEGTLGLIRAIEKFDLSCDVSFVTYAMYWMRSAMQHSNVVSAVVSAAVKVSMPQSIESESDNDPRLTIKAGLTAPDSGPLHSLLDSELRSTLRRNLRSLRPRWRAVLIFRANGGSMREIAMSLGVTQKRVQKIQSQAISELSRVYGLALPASVFQTRQRKNERSRRSRCKRRERRAATTECV